MERHWSDAESTRSYQREQGTSCDDSEHNQHPVLKRHAQNGEALDRPVLVLHLTLEMVLARLPGGAPASQRWPCTPVPFF